MATGSARAFSLIELIVVAGITSVLLGLTLPVIANARAEARRTACAIEMRGLGTAVSLYAAEERDLAPMALARRDDAWRLSGGQPVPSYTLAPGLWHETARGRGWLTDDAMTCPADRDPQPIFPDNASRTNRRPLSLAYYLTDTALADDRTEWDEAFAEVRRLGDAAYPSSKALLWESVDYHRPAGPAARLGSVVCGGDLAVKHRLFDEARPGVLFWVDLGPEAARAVSLNPELHRITSAFKSTRDGLGGRDW